MDLERPVRYRYPTHAFDLNTVEILGGDGKRRGVILEEADFGQVQGVGYVEKRAQGDGNDASDVWLSARQIRLRGFVYGETRADAFDRLQDLRSALTPTAAYAASPSQKGYLPLEFDVPTQDFVNFGEGQGDGWRLMQMYARPKGQPAFSVRRDAGSGGNHYKGGAIQWSCDLECKDPRIYLRQQQWVYFNGSKSGVLTNRGDYPAPLDILLIVASCTVAGTLRVQLGPADLTITVPVSAVQQIFRYSATLGGILTVEANTIEALRMDLLSATSNANRLLVGSPSSSYTLTKTGTYTITGDGSTTGSRLMYNEAFA
jgi:hypothetical protein